MFVTIDAVARILGWPLALAVTLAVAVGVVLAVVSLRTEREYVSLVVAGDEALTRGDLGRALEAYTGAITLRPDSMAAHLKRGLAYRQRNEPQAALRDLRRASELDDSAPRVFEWQGDVNLGLGRYRRAADRFEQSLVRDDRQAEVHYKLGVARYREGRAAAAIDPLRRAIALRGSMPEAHYLLGLSLRDAGRVDEALVSLGTAIMQAPGLLVAREARADLLRLRGDISGQVDDLTALSALEPGRPERAVAVGLAYAHAGRPEAAVLALGRAAERFQESAAVFSAIGRTWLRASEQSRDSVLLDKALQALRRAISMSAAPDAETLSSLGRAELRAGDLVAAERALRAAAAHTPVPVDTYADLAEITERTSRIIEARDFLVRYAALTAGSPAAGATALRVAALSQRVGDLNTAAYWYERVLAEQGPAVSVLYRLAEVEAARGRASRLAEIVSQGLALDPAHAGLRALRKTLPPAH